MDDGWPVADISEAISREIPSGPSSFSARILGITFRETRKGYGEWGVW